MSGLLFANRVVEPVRAMTGIGRYVHHLTLGLAKAGGGRYVLCAPGEAGRPRWLPPEVAYRRVPGPRKAVHAAWTALGRPRLERMVGDFDFVHALHPSYPIPTRRPAAITLHDLMPLQHPEWYARDERWGFRRTLEMVGERRWAVIVDSQYVKEQVVALGSIPADGVSVVHLGVGDEFRRPLPATALQARCASLGLVPGNYILAVGNVSTRKNLVTLVRSMAELGPGPPLALAGRPHTSSAAVRREIERLGLTGRIRLLGFVPGELLPPLVQGAIALAHPSVDEGFGIPPLEAMAAGTPVIAARAGSIPEIVADAGLLVPGGAADEWAGAIARVLADEELRASMGAAGRARAAAFSWERTVAGTLEVHRRYGLA